MDAAKPALLAQHHPSMSLHSRSAYKDWGDEDDEDSMAAVKWISPAPNTVLVSGNKLVATWSTPVRPIASPSFQLCLVETEECGDTVWPKVKKLSSGQYTITLKIPQLDSDNDFFIRMVDDKGTAYDTPEFKLQGSESQSSALALNSGFSSSSSVLPDSLTSAPPDSGLSGSNSSGADNQELNGDGSRSPGPPDSNSPSLEAENNAKAQLNNEEIDRDPPKNAGKGLRPTVNGTATSTVSISRNSTTASATSTISSLALTPSITNGALVRSPNDNKPSTAAIVVPLAIFAAALAGLLFSLRQRSRAKEIRGAKSESALDRVTSKDSCVSASSTSGSGSSRTDLERAMDFIVGVRARHSPQLTPLPPSIESRRRERHDSRMRQSNASFLNKMSPGRKSISISSSVPDMSQRVRQRSGPLPPIPSVVEMEPTDIYPGSKIPSSRSYPIIQSHPPELPRTESHQLPVAAPVENFVHHLVHTGPGPEVHPNTSEVISVAPITHLPTSISLAGMPRPPYFVQPQVHNVPSGVSWPNIATSSIHYPASVSVPNSGSSPLDTLPHPLRAGLPRPPTVPVPDVILNPGYSESLEPPSQPQPQLEYKPTEQSPAGPRPAIPYSTRPQTVESQTNVLLNPYEAIARALRTPRLG